MLSFNQILSARLEDDIKIKKGTVTAVTTTDYDDMVNRSITGKLLYGEKGRVIGAMTAKQNTQYHSTPDTTKHNYTFYLTVDDILSPLIEIKLYDYTKVAKDLEATFNVILAQK